MLYDDTVCICMLCPCYVHVIGHHTELSYQNCLVFWNMNLFSHSVGNVILPIDFNSMIFQRGRRTNHQPDQVRSVALDRLAHPGHQTWRNPRN